MGLWDDPDRPNEILWFAAQTLIALLLGVFAFLNGYTAVGLGCSALVLLGIAMIVYVAWKRTSEG